MYSVEGHVGGAYSNTFVQPFVDYPVGGLIWEFTSETNYICNSDDWSVPVTLTASLFFMVGEQPILIGAMLNIGQNLRRAILKGYRST